MRLKSQLCGCRLNLTALAYELSGTIKGRKLLDRLSDYQLVKKDNSILLGNQYRYKFAGSLISNHALHSLKICPCSTVSGLHEIT